MTAAAALPPALRCPRTTPMMPAGIGLVEYRRRFAAAPVAFLDHGDYAPAEYHPEHAAEHKDRLTVAGTFRLAIEQAAKRHPAAESLIVRAALLAPESIPLFLFAEAREKFGEPFASMLAGDGLDEACELSPSSAARRLWMSAMRCSRPMRSASIVWYER